MMLIEYICVGLIVLICLIFIIRKLKSSDGLSCGSCPGCDEKDSCKSQDADQEQH